MAQPSADPAKHAAAARAVAMVEEGMALGLGSGTTAEVFLRLLAERVRREGLTITGVATSGGTAGLAEALGLRLVTLEAAGPLDLAVDGADEIDGDLNLIKGGGAALLREKIVAAASARMLVIAGAGKRVARLGAFPLPVEIVRFGAAATQRAIAAALDRAEVDARRISLRQGPDGPLVTDEGHHILDLHLAWIGDPQALGAALDRVTGVVEHGLFIGMAESVILGRPDGGTEVIRRAPAAPDPIEAMRNQDA